jgi:hypothetical protein
MNDNWRDMDRQFEMDESETRDHWRALKARRRAEGRCWQCAEPVAECKCPNVKHPIDQ